MDLTPENFISRIKNMEKSDRNKLKLKELIDLIVQAPLYTYDENATMKNIENDIARMAGRLDTVLDAASTLILNDTIWNFDVNSMN